MEAPKTTDKTMPTSAQIRVARAQFFLEGFVPPPKAQTKIIIIPTIGMQVSSSVTN